VPDSPTPFPLLWIWQRLKRLLGLPRPNTMTFDADTQLVQAIQELAVQDKRSEDEITSELLSYALAQRHSADENLRKWHELSPRERDIAALTCLGYTNRQIAARLFISPETVKTHIRNLLRKFEARSKAELRRLLAEWDFSEWETHRR
jgi:DNA-binding CsgD family transcriptional regulator